MALYKAETIKAQDLSDVATDRAVMIDHSLTSEILPAVRVILGVNHGEGWITSDEVAVVLRRADIRQRVSLGGVFHIS